MNVIEHALVQHRGGLGLAALGLDCRLQTVLITPRFVTSRHVVALVLAADDPRPRAVAKIPRRPGDDGGVRTEARILRRLAHLTGGRIQGVPSVLGTVDVDGRSMLVETALVGLPLTQDEVVHDLDMALNAGKQFLSALPIVRVPADATGWYDDAVRAPLARLQELVGIGGDISDLCARTHTALAPLREVALPRVFEHGDMSYPNLLIAEDGASLRVIDWERAGEDGLPGHDMVFFLQFLSQCLNGFATPAQQTTAFEHAFVGRRAWARPTLDDHLRERGVDPRLSGYLILAGWARAAASLASRLEVDVSAARGSRHAVVAAVLGERDVTIWRHALERVEDGSLLLPTTNPFEGGGRPNA